MADGSTRFIQYGYSNAGVGGVPAGVPIRSITAAGVIVNTAQLDRSNTLEPSAGELDTSLAGQEVVVADFRRLRILRADLTPVREITTTPLEAFDFDRVSLADLDGDGTLEIIALARDIDDPASGFYRPSGSLYVFRGNGQLYSPNYPIRLTSTRMPNGNHGADAAAVELNGSGNKEIVITLQDNDSTIYEIQARNADGTVYAAWPNPTPSFPSQSSFVEIVASDLDRDGRSEMVFWEAFNFAQTIQLRVLNSNGTTRAGWPVSAPWPAAIAIGDLDRDQRDEIIFANAQQPVSVLRPDGMPLGGTWPILQSPNAPVIADVDNDTFPDIVIGDTALVGDADPRYFDVRTKVISRTGAVMREWRHFGIAGQQPYISTPAVGDFNGDGKADIACHVPTVLGNGTIDGQLLDGVFTVLTTGSNVNPAGDDWPLVNRNPQNSRSRLVATATLPQPATNPSPANGATGVGTGATLAWTAGAGATSHDVSFGTANPPAFRVNQTGATFNPGALTASTTYFWRIDEKNTAGTRTGTVWSFTTAGSCTPESNAAFCTRLGRTASGQRHRQLRRGAHGHVVRNLHVAADLRRRRHAQRLRRWRRRHHAVQRPVHGSDHVRGPELQLRQPGDGSGLPRNAREPRRRELRQLRSRPHVPRQQRAGHVQRRQHHAARQAQRRLLLPGHHGRLCLGVLLDLVATSGARWTAVRWSRARPSWFRPLRRPDAAGV